MNRPSEGEIVLAIKQALEQETNFAIKKRGHRNRFYTSEVVDIEMPEPHMQRFEIMLNRAIGIIKGNDHAATD